MSLCIPAFTGLNDAFLVAFLGLEGRVCDVFSASKRGGGLSEKRCAVESDMLKGIFIFKIVLWLKLLVCPWCRGLREVRQECCSVSSQALSRKNPYS